MVDPRVTLKLYQQTFPQYQEAYLKEFMTRYGIIPEAHVSHEERCECWEAVLPKQ